MRRDALTLGQHLDLRSRRHSPTLHYYVVFRKLGLGGLLPQNQIYSTDFDLRLIEAASNFFAENHASSQ